MQRRKEIRKVSAKKKTPHRRLQAFGPFSSIISFLSALSFSTWFASSSYQELLEAVTLCMGCVACTWASLRGSAVHGLPMTRSIRAVDDCELGGFFKVVTEYEA